jgi:glycosyltransferase involved in cell wall biosynthesis
MEALCIGSLSTKWMKTASRELVTIVGPVAKDQLLSVYSQVDFVFLLSKLESFSNNIIEAWHFGKPLVVSNEEWAKALCGDAAIYVDRDSPCSIAEVLIETARHPARIDAVVSAGRNQLQRFPAISERILMELKFVESVVQSS